MPFCFPLVLVLAGATTTTPGAATESVAVPAAAPAETAAASSPGSSSPIPAESRQLLLVVSPDWNATKAELRRYTRVSLERPWTEDGEAVDVSIGRSGLGWGRGLHRETGEGPIKHEGDGRAPAGVFDLRGSVGYAKDPLAGTRLPYQQAEDTLRCVDDPRSHHYNTLVDEKAVAVDWSSAEEMRRRDELYRYVVWVGHNDRPVEPGAGSCIFLHLRASTDSVTAGCTAFEREPMERLLRWLDPATRPVLVQLPWAEYARLRTRWSLPTVPTALAR
jgi:L,D-peptidoglycan transpeptidase YkuD (ErfK/YbiS/YcfS/YnhG family)